MKRPLLYKCLSLAALILLLLVPISMIDGVIEDRQQTHQQVLHEIAQSSTFSQKVSGPILVLPYRKKVLQWKVEAQTNARVQEEVWQAGVHYLLPEKFDLNANLTTEVRSRGIYEALLYHADATLSGHFQVPSNFGVQGDDETTRFSDPYIALAIEDIRGIENALTIEVNGKAITMAPSANVSKLGEGVHAMLERLDISKKTRMDFSLALRLQGTESLSITPVGKETRVQLVSDWPHPSFMGNQLPASRSVGAEGFSATWNTSYFSSNIVESFDRCMAGECNAFGSKAFGVSLIDPVDRYVKSDRAIKYALLFIALTFGSFVLFEVLKRLVVHPVQYALVGLSLAFFYLLLVSLSEHISFGLSYTISAAACILLIGFYLSYVLASVYRALGFTAGLTALYGFLYALLCAEDYALLMGAILLFSVLGLFMFLTRHIDWYSVGQKPLDRTSDSACQ
ncbi:cell envelope integrity protein CreD [Simiduia curdlanivorans]|uniref:Cell envelope integrity protein CreD n=1 Tax=Simiduia curdlanivorans TaxID=1492769 RepID=A0ABV8V7R8_9GAMM|nr:cell envelope integrity protein CreD [Simiduia curdlanivorans]MDN3638611.1 cell envelope integrity protein CreD [Simiduia curdlanivorans]